MPVSTETIEVTIAMPADGPSFGVAPSGTWTWMSTLSNIVGFRPRSGAFERTQDEAASIDSFITSPSLPVVFIRPLPGSFSASIEQQVAADLGPGETGDDADLVLGLGEAVLEAAARRGTPRGSRA